MARAKALTDRFIKTVKVEKRQEIPDGDERGLYLLVLPTGVKSWLYRYRFQGRSRNFTIGRYDEIPLKEARERVATLRRLVASGVDPFEQKKAASRPDMPSTVEALIRRYLEEHAKTEMKASSAKNAERVLEREIIAHWGGRKLSTITSEEVVKRIAEVKNSPRFTRESDKDVDPSTLPRRVATSRRLHAVFRAFCNWAISQGVITENPCKGVKAKRIKSRARNLNDEEIVRVVHGALDMGYPFGTMVKMMLLCGQRRNEIARLRWDEINFKQERIELPPERTKNGEEHLYPLPEEIIFDLSQRRDATPEALRGDYVFSTRTGKPVSGFSKFKKQLDGIINGRGGPIRNWTLHDLRRTFVTGLARIGIRSEVHEAIVNHSRSGEDEVEKIYNRYKFQDEMREALEYWSAYIWGLHGWEGQYSETEMRALVRSGQKARPALG